MPDVGEAHWTFVDLPDGHTWEVWRQGSSLEDTERDLFGQVRATMQGYLATDQAGRTSGPYATLDEAAYPLALRGLTTVHWLALESRRSGRQRRSLLVLALAAGVAVRTVLAMRRR
jgi:hypothetical protein